MQVDPKFTTGAVTWVNTSQPVARKSRVDSEHVNFSSADALNDDYRKVPEVRVDAVSKAKELVAQATYPPPETIKKIANLLAMQLANDSD
jgi:hypothetical protein